MNWPEFYRCVCGLNYAQCHEEIDLLLLRLKSVMGADKIAIALLDKDNNTRQFYSAGFSDKSRQFYISNRSSDLYLQTYLQRDLTGKSIDLQQMLPDPNRVNPAFLDNFHSHLDVNYSFGLIIPLPESRQLMISSHRERTPFTKGFDHDLNGLGAALLPWACQTLDSLRSFEQGNILAAENEHLTQAEQQVLRLLSEGLAGSEIAEHRHVSKETVKSQIKSLLHKTHCRHQNELLSRLFELKHRGISPV